MAIDREKTVKIIATIKEHKGKIEKIPADELAKLDDKIDECCLGNCNNCDLGEVMSRGDLCLQVTNLVKRRKKENEKDVFEAENEK